MTRNEFYKGLVPLPVGDELLAEYEIDGSDLEVADPEQALSIISQRVISMQEKAAAGQLTHRDVDMWLTETAASVRDTFRGYLNQIYEEHPLYTAAVQNWALSDLKRRKADDEYTTPESRHLELIEILTNVRDDLLRDDEDPTLIHIVELWREEECAAQCAKDARDLMREAA